MVFLLQQVVLDQEQSSSTHPTRRGHLRCLETLLGPALRVLLAFSEQRPEKLLITHHARGSPTTVSWSRV